MRCDDVAESEQESSNAVESTGKEIHTEQESAAISGSTGSNRRAMASRQNESAKPQADRRAGCRNVATVESGEPTPTGPAADMEVPPPGLEGELSRDFAEAQVAIGPPS